MTTSLHMSQRNPPIKIIAAGFEAIQNVIASKLFAPNSYFEVSRKNGALVTSFLRISTIRWEFCIYAQK